jgi:hypothetical protein
MGVLSPESCEFPKELIMVKDDNFFFGQTISNDDTIMSTLRNKMNYFIDYMCDQLKWETFFYNWQEM